MEDLAYYYFKKMFKSNDDCIICIDSYLRVVYISRSAIDLMKLTSVSNLSDILPFKHLNKVSNAIANNESITFRFMHVVDNSAKKCTLIPHLYNNKFYAVLTISNTDPIRFNEIEKAELGRMINNIHSSICHSSNMIINRTENLGANVLKSLNGQTIIKSALNIRRSFDNLRYMVNDRTDYAYLTTININSYLNNVFPQIIELVGKDRIEITLDCCKTILNIDTSFEMLDLLICNVISNSVKNTVGVAKITIKTISHKDSAVIIFSDNGQGCSNINEMLSQEYENSFYYNIPTASTGLFVIKKIAEDHKGAIFAKPNPDGGLILGIQIPKAKPVDAFYEVDDTDVHRTAFSSLYVGLSEIIQDFDFSKVTY